MLSSLRLSNFRSFKDSGIVPLSRLNILLGTNSSGKSSFLQSLLLLKQTLEDPNLENVLVTNGRIVRLGGFDDLVFGHCANNSIGISLILDPGFVEENTPYFGSPPGPDADRVKFSANGIELFLGCNRRNKQFFMNRFSVSSQSVSNLVGGSCDSNGKPKTAASDVLQSLRPSSVSFFHFLPTTLLKRAARGSDPAFSLYRALYANRVVWERMFRDLTYIGPVRSTIQMHYTVTGESPTSVGVSGENLLAVLYQDQRLRSRRRRFLLTRLNKWLEGHFGFVRDIKLEPLTKGRSVYALTGLDPQTNVRVNLSQVGFGVSQAAPIIVQGFLSPSGSTMIIEQPEIHLHPSAQADLADLFIDILKQRKQLLVETHSEHLVLRIRRRIAEGQLRAEDVRLLFVSKGSEGTRIEPLAINTKGQIESWPKGFFEEGYAESLKIVEAVS